MKKGKFKQILALVLTAATVTAPLLGCQNGGEQKESENTAESTEPATDGETAPSEEPTVSGTEPVLVYDFESVDGVTVKNTGSGDDTSSDGKLCGKARIGTAASAGVPGADANGHVLVLDGSANTYFEFPQGFFDGRNKMTITMDVKSDSADGNFFTFTYGKSDAIYDFLRIRGSSIYNAITNNSWGAETSISSSRGADVGVWQNVALVINGRNRELYVDGILRASGQVALQTGSLGKDLLAYLGKSFYSGDSYFKGAFDNVKVYDRVLTKAEIRSALNMNGEAIYDITSKKSQFTWTLDEENKEIVFCFLKNGNSKDMANVDLIFDLGADASIKDLKDTYDLTKENEITLTYEGKETVYKLIAKIGVNPVLNGEFADPDIDRFNGKYYIYPTTDGFAGWSGYQFHCFSSDDMINWKDEGIILDVRNNDVDAEDNANGKPGVPWATGSAWAPTIEEKNGKYYFYFCAKRSDGVSCIGAAVADSPTGPFRAMDEPLLTPEICAKEANINGGQTIDPSIYTEDGVSYMLFGNGYGAIVQLGDDMTSIVPGTMHRYSGTTDLRESITVVKRNGVYHFTWSCDDTGSENYHVNYGTSSSLYGTISYKGTILSKEPEAGILGTGHHSILYIPETDEYFICYHRFVTPVDRYPGDHGVHRETCIDRLTFDSETGLMNRVIPTHSSILE